jgi:hypothetical protein
MLATQAPEHVPATVAVTTTPALLIVLEENARTRVVGQDVEIRAGGHARDGGQAVDRKPVVSGSIPCSDFRLASVSPRSSTPTAMWP